MARRVCRQGHLPPHRRRGARSVHGVAGKGLAPARVHDGGQLRAEARHRHATARRYGRRCLRGDLPAGSARQLDGIAHQRIGIAHQHHALRWVSCGKLPKRIKSWQKKGRGRRGRIVAAPPLPQLRTLKLHLFIWLPPVKACGKTSADDPLQGFVRGGTNRRAWEAGDAHKRSAGLARAGVTTCARP